MKWQTSALKYPGDCKVCGKVETVCKGSDLKIAKCLYGGLKANMPLQMPNTFWSGVRHLAIVKY